MCFVKTCAALGLVLTTAAAPIGHEERQVSGLGGEGAGTDSGSGLGSVPSFSFSGAGASLPTGLSGSGSDGGQGSDLDGSGGTSFRVPSPSSATGALSTGITTGAGLGGSDGGAPPSLSSLAGIFPSDGGLPSGVPSGGSLPTALPIPSESTPPSTGSGIHPLETDSALAGSGLDQTIPTRTSGKRQYLGRGTSGGFASLRGGGSLERRQSLASLGSGSDTFSGLGSGSSDPFASLESRSSNLGFLDGGSSSGGSGLGRLTGGGASNSAAAASTASSVPSSSSGSGSGDAYPGASDSSYSGGSTATDVSQNTECRDMTFIFARGTGEMGTMGSIVGPPLAQDLQKTLGSNEVSVEGLDYAASAAGNADLGSTCGSDMAKIANEALKQCPKTKLVLSGYSQGAMCVHGALKNGVDGSKVAAVAVFGDPLKSESFSGVNSSKVTDVCGDSDSICDASGSNASGSHLSYGSDAEKAAAFIVKATGL